MLRKLLDYVCVSAGCKRIHLGRNSIQALKLKFLLLSSLKCSLENTKFIFEGLQKSESFVHEKVLR